MILLPKCKRLHDCLASAYIMWSQGIRYIVVKIAVKMTKVSQGPS